MFSLLLFVVAALPFSGAEWFSSFNHVLGLLEEESDLLNYLKEYVVQEYAKLEYLEDMYNGVVMTSCTSEKFPRKCMENPTNQYATMKRLAHTWKTISAAVADKNATERFLWAVDRNLPDFPTLEDIRGSIQGIIRIQAAYGFPVGELSRGIVGRSIQGNILTAGDCFDVAEVAYAIKNYVACIDWSLEARAKILWGDPSISLERVLYLLARCSYDLQDLELAFEAMREVVKIAPSYMEVADFYRHVLAEVIKHKHKAMSARRDFVSAVKKYIANKPKIGAEIFEQLCRKAKDHAKPESSNTLRCYLWDGNRNPRLLLQPVKVEVQNESPFLVRFYDLVSDIEIEYLKRKASPLLERAKVVGESGVGMESDYRVTKTVFLESEDDRVISKLNTRIGDVTGFDMRHTELVSVSNYGIGGHYNVHVDPFGNRNRNEMGDRIATMLIYLSDVDQGGNTVFTRAEVAVTPIKGSAVFWHNLLTNGSVDEETLHAGCPVATGDKWIINKWIREKAASTCQPCPSKECPGLRYKMLFSR